MRVIAQAIAERQSAIDRLQAEIKALTDVEQIITRSTDLRQTRKEVPEVFESPVFDLPPRPPKDPVEFTTDIKSFFVGGPGFFPVHSGRLVPDGALSQQATVHIVFFGTDWGWKCRAETCQAVKKAGRNCGCQRSLQDHPPSGSYPTERNLSGALKQVKGLDHETVVLTNAVLGLSIEDQSGNEGVFGKDGEYLRECGKYHQKWLSREKPRLVVLMGAEHLNTYRRVWSEVWPDLFGEGGEWSPKTKKLGEPLSRGQGIAAIKAAPTGPWVQLVYHPSRTYWWEKYLKQTVDFWRKRVPQQ